ncbi:copper-transporting atpase 1, partial [Cystoisospora suis]
RYETERLLSELSRNVGASAIPAFLVLFLSLATRLDALPSFLSSERYLFTNMFMFFLSLPVQFICGQCFHRAALK